MNENVSWRKKEKKLKIVNVKLGVAFIRVETKIFRYVREWAIFKVGR